MRYNNNYLNFLQTMIILNVIKNFLASLDGAFYLQHYTDKAYTHVYTYVQFICVKIHIPAAAVAA